MNTIRFIEKSRFTALINLLIREEFSSKNLENLGNNGVNKRVFIEEMRGEINPLIFSQSTLKLSSLKQ